MGYNTYWCGSLEITPPLTPEEQRNLEAWCHFNESHKLGIIDDPDVLKRLCDAEWKYDIPYCPLDDITTDETSTLLCFSNEGYYVSPMAIVLAELLRQHIIPIMKKCEGSIFWNGDEQEDLGEIVVKDGDVWICPAAIVYPKPGDPETEKIVP